MGYAIVGETKNVKAFWESLFIHSRSICIMHIRGHFQCETLGRAVSTCPLGGQRVKKRNLFKGMWELGRTRVRPKRVMSWEVWHLRGQRIVVDLADV